MGQSAKPRRKNRTITIDFHDETTYFALLGNTKACVEFVFAFVLSIGFQLTHKPTCSGGGCLTRHSHYVRVRLGGLTIWRMQCATCKACVHHPAALRSEIPHDATGGGSRRPVSHPWGAQSGMVRGDRRHFPHGALSLGLCPGSAESGG